MVLTIISLILSCCGPGGGGWGGGVYTHTHTHVCANDGMFYTVWFLRCDLSCEIQSAKICRHIGKDFSGHSVYKLQPNVFPVGLNNYNSRDTVRYLTITVGAGTYYYGDNIS